MSFNTGGVNVSNVTENWLFEISYSGYSSGTIRLALKDYSDGTNFYYGVVLNKPSIRESIDLKRSLAKASNLSINIANFDYKGDKISEFLFGSIHYFINRNVVVKSVINDDSAITIGNFRLVDFSTNGDTIDLQFDTHKPWENISIPQNKHEDYNIYEPVVYGSYKPANGKNISTSYYGTVTYGTGYATDINAHANHSADINGVRGGVYPVPVLSISSDTILTLMPRSYVASDYAYIHNYVKDSNGQFIALRHHSSIFTDSGNRVDGVTQNDYDDSGLNILSSNIQVKHSGGTWYPSDFSGYIATTITERSADGQIGSLGSSIIYENGHNMFKWDASADNTLEATSFAISKEIKSGALTHYFEVTSPKKQFSYDSIMGYKAKCKAIDDDGSAISNEQLILWQCFSNRYDPFADVLITQDKKHARFYAPNTVHYGSGTSYLSVATGTKEMQFGEETANTPGGYHAMLPNNLLFRTTADNSFPNFENFKLQIHELTLNLLQRIALFSTSGIGKDDAEELARIKHFYCGGNGLKHGITALSGNNITEIHEAHLDLLNRFTGLDTSNMNTIDGWSDLDSAKDWLVRYWQLEPVELEKELKKLQYEGGFIFRYKKGDTSNPQYIFIKDQYTTTDYVLTKHDLGKVNIQLDNYSELLTKMSVDYQRHPAKSGKYLFNQVASNSSSRTNYNITSKENIVDVKLKSYVRPEIPTTPSTNPNDDFYTYYNNIYGDIKVNISGTIVNPKFYDIDIGDTVEFNNMYPEKAFGRSFTDVVYMITSLSRTMGSLRFTAREIGAIE